MSMPAVRAAHMSRLPRFASALSVALLAIPACVTNTDVAPRSRSAEPRVLAATGSGGLVVVEALEAIGRREVGVTSVGPVVLPPGPWAATVRRDLDDELAAALAAGAPTELELDLGRHPMGGDDDPPVAPAQVVLARVARVTSLESLDVRGPWVLGPRELEMLAALPHLRRLVLAVDRVQVGALAGLVGLPALGTLDLSDTRSVDSEAWSDLVHLRALRTLRATGIEPAFSWGSPQPKVGDAELALIAASAPRLQHLDLSHAGSAITDAGVVRLSALRYLEHLILDDCWKVGTEGLRALRDLPLRELSLGGEGRGLSEVDEDGLEEIGYHTQLHILRLGAHRQHRYPVETRGWRALAKLRALEVLDLGELPLEDEGAMIISALPLRELACDLGPGFGPEGAARVASIASLERLWIRGTLDPDTPPAFDDAWLTGLASSGRLVSLRIDEVCGAYGDAGLEALGACQRLERLELHSSRVNRAGVAALARLPNLRRLSIRGAFDDTAVGELARATSLLDLSFTSGRITPACLPALAGLGLEQLHVGTQGRIMQDDLGRIAASLPRLRGFGAGVYSQLCDRCAR